MTKTNILKELKMWNNTKNILGINVRRRCWNKKQWQVVDNLNFDNANIIKEFFYQTELAEYIFNNQ